MAIKITNLGKKPEDRPLQGTCKNCDTTIECLVSDAEKYSDQREGTFYSLKCPTCKYTMYAYPKSNTKQSYMTDFNGQR